MVQFKVSRLAALMISSSAICLSVPLIAAADKRGAPIEFAGTNQSQPAAVEQPRQTATQTNSPQTERLVFNYPGAPAQTPKAEQKTLAAIPSYNQYSAQPSVQSPPSNPPKADLIIPNKPIRITANTSPTSQPVGRPLTLSTVKVSRDTALEDESGLAGIYPSGFEGKPTANGEIFRESDMTAAHPSLPLPSLVQVINLTNGREIVVRVNDRGPFEPGRMIDLSPRAADVLGLRQNANAKVKLRYLGPAPVKTVQASASRPSVIEEPIAEPNPLPVVATPKVVAPKAVATSPMKIKADPTGRIYIQAGAFAEINNAESMNAALGRKLPVKIESARVRNADYFRVLVGPFKSRRDANIYRDHLAASGIVDGFLVER